MALAAQGRERGQVLRNFWLRLLAESVLKKIGLTPSSALRLMMVKIVQDEKLPFAPLVLNEKTISAMKEARRGGLKSYKSAAEMTVALNASRKEGLPPRRCDQPDAPISPPSSGRSPVWDQVRPQA